jgi:ADP-ribose pyrophosphatase YjhB (NUDIX family)
MREYTAASVFEGIRDGAPWAEATMDPTLIDWPARQAAAAIPFEVIDGRPIIPGPSTGITRGRNELGHWGEMQCADAVVIAVDQPITRRRVRRRRRWVLLIERGDGHGWAIPGGKLDAGETALQAAQRELQEETGLVLPGARWTSRPAILVPDPRASDEAWMVTTPAVAEIRVGGPDDLPPVLGADDARRAIWCPADSYGVVVAHLVQVYDGTVFAAHQDLLAEILYAAKQEVSR